MGGEGEKEKKKRFQWWFFSSNVSKRVNVFFAKWDRKYWNISQLECKEFKFTFRGNEFQVPLMQPSTGVRNTLGIHYLNSMEKSPLEIYFWESLVYREKLKLGEPTVSF